jgi:hypothetical protein
MITVKFPEVFGDYDKAVAQLRRTGKPAAIHTETYNPMTCENEAITCILVKQKTALHSDFERAVNVKKPLIEHTLGYTAFRVSGHVRVVQLQSQKK